MTIGILAMLILLHWRFVLTEVHTGTPILCDVDSEDGPRVQGFIKETLEIHPHGQYIHMHILQH
uniref:Uncharacterized protein n=1 Tax=Romanomermis culicivorax TaxID=13658 RepID=A0A915IIU2_ROMCU